MPSYSAPSFRSVRSVRSITQAALLLGYCPLEVMLTQSYKLKLARPYQPSCQAIFQKKIQASKKMNMPDLAWLITAMQN